MSLNASLAAQSFVWRIPLNLKTADYSILVQAASEPFMFDMSDAPFRIAAPSVSVISPNGGEYWPPGTSQTVRWTIQGDIGTYVRIDLYKNGALNSTLTTAALASSGSYTWTVPTTQAQGSDYKIRISSTTNVTYNDSSDANFNILPVQVTLTLPNGGELWRPGTVQAITWTATGPVGSDARIELLKANTVVTTIADAAPLAVGSYRWMVPVAQAHGNDYKVRITSNQVAGITDSSNANFTIDELYAVSVSKAGTGSGTVTSSPAGIACGATCAANFSSGTTVTLTATPQAGSTFTGWSGACTGGGACILGIDGDKAVTATFTVPPPGITVISPNGGESWSTGATQSIRWSYTGDPGTITRIDLLKGGVLNRTITTAATISARTFSWYVPTTQAMGSDYTIRITSATNATVSDTSDAPFPSWGRE